jgi:tRNA-splicing ligase RtcB
MPAAVGVDIGCGMRAVRTQFTLDDIRGTGKDLRFLHRSIARAMSAVRCPLSAATAWTSTRTRISRSMW